MGNKKWYLLRGVEYSADLKFFIAEQVFLHSLTKQLVDKDYEKSSLGKHIKSVIIKEKPGEYKTNHKRVQYFVSSYTVSSRLESFNFGEVFEGDEEHVKKELSVIHNKLLSGGYGEGVFVD